MGLVVCEWRWDRNGDISISLFTSFLLQELSFFALVFQPCLPPSPEEAAFRKQLPALPFYSGARLVSRRFRRHLKR